MIRLRSLAATVFAGSVVFVWATAGCGNRESTSTDTTPARPEASSAGDKKLVIAWAEWEPAKQLDKLADEWTKETGIEVEVQQIPWSDFENKIKLAWSGQEDAYDLIVGDSQWLGKAATQGHYVDLTDWAGQNVPVADIAPAALTNYGEYPAGSGKYYALPCMSDATVFAYRKDLFESPSEQAAFQTRYKRALAPPKTWQEFRDVAEFFTRPDRKLHGAALFYSKEYDGATMGFDQVLWSWGGKLSENNQAEGVINSPTAVAALQFYAVELKKFTPTTSENYYFAECLRAFQQGEVAIAQQWFAFLPGLTDPSKNPHAANTGYFMVPKGPAGQYASLGGQGISVSAYSRRQDDAKKFLAWFHTEDTQKRWVELGGLTANTKVAATDAFKKATLYNAVFAQTVPYLKDFYNNPQYSELLTASQNYLNQAVAGDMTPKQALDAIAKEHQTILSQAQDSQQALAGK